MGLLYSFLRFKKVKEIIGRIGRVEINGVVHEGEITDVREGEMIRINEDDPGRWELPDFIEIDGIQYPPDMVEYD